MNEFKRQMNINEEVVYELRGARESAELRELVCARASELLPPYEARLMEALFTDFDEQVFINRIELKSKFTDISMDFISEGYAGKSKEEYESERKAAVEELLSEQDSLSAVRKFYELAVPLNEAAKGVAYNNFAKPAAITANYIEVCSRLLKNGKLSLTEIVDCLPGLKMYDLYGLAEKQNTPVNVTEDELRRIHEERESTGKTKAVWG